MVDEVAPGEQQVGDNGTDLKVVEKGSGLKFPSPIRSYDVHIYFWQTDPFNTAKAKALREEIQEKFPELKVYKFWDTPIGPHPTGMFEVDLKTPEEFATFVPWIQVNRRGLSVLVHPNTGKELNDHTVNAIWIGDKQVLNTSFLANKDSGYGNWSAASPTPPGTDSLPSASPDRPPGWPLPPHGGPGWPAGMPLPPGWPRMPPPRGMEPLSEPSRASSAPPTSDSKEDVKSDPSSEQTEVSI